MRYTLTNRLKNEIHTLLPIKHAECLNMFVSFYIPYTYYNLYTYNKNTYYIVINYTNNNCMY